MSYYTFARFTSVLDTTSMRSASDAKGVRENGDWSSRKHVDPVVIVNAKSSLVKSLYELYFLTDLKVRIASA